MREHSGDLCETIEKQRAATKAIEDKFEQDGIPVHFKTVLQELTYDELSPKINAINLAINQNECLFPKGDFADFMDTLDKKHLLS
jgi:hypothetical protein